MVFNVIVTLTHIHRILFKISLLHALIVFLFPSQVDLTQLRYVGQCAPCRKAFEMIHTLEWMPPQSDYC